jgi:2-oxoglutarate dehydrogenase E2 component (dihydrolipoamide succinyltransferase)
MSVDITVPQLGESIVEATVGRWLKAEGEPVSEGEPVVELETEKVNMEVMAPVAGVLQTIVRKEGETVAIGDTLGAVAEGSASLAARPAPAEEPPVPQPAAIQTASGPTEQPAEAGRATPLARRIAGERGVDLRQVHGSGPGGRVTHDDVEAYLATQAHGTDGNGARATAAPAAPAAPTGPAPAHPAPTRPAPAAQPPAARAPSGPPATPAPAASGRWEERVRLSRRRQTIARRLVETQQTAAMLTTFNEVDMSAILDVRQRRRDAFRERHSVSLGFMSFFTRAVIGALKAYPRLNAEIQGAEMVLKHYYDIGIAVSTEEGLVVPVLRDADRLSFAEIEQRVAEFARRARSGELTLEDLQGGTFTITNGGVFGSLLSTPILNGPQVGILGMHKIQERPVAVGGQVVIHPMMYVALSYDHRIVDGAEAVSFLVRVKELLEDPETLLLEG